MVFFNVIISNVYKKMVVKVNGFDLFWMYVKFKRLGKDF